MNFKIHDSGAITLAKICVPKKSNYNVVDMHEAKATFKQSGFQLVSEVNSCDHLEHK